jgi:hypothetical protein
MDKNILSLNMQKTIHTARTLTTCNHPKRNNSDTSTYYIKNINLKMKKKQPRILVSKTPQFPANTGCVDFSTHHGGLS